jgi:hypothetical protein
MKASDQLVQRTGPGLHPVVFDTLRRVRPPPARVLDVGVGTRPWSNWRLVRLVVLLRPPLLRFPPGGNDHAEGERP